MSNGTAPTAPLPPEPAQPVVVSGGTLSLILGLAKIIAGLTTERALILFICVGAGWMFWTRERSQAEDKANMIRLADEAKERDRQHCDSREEKIRRDREVEAEKMRAWYSSLMEAQRKFEGDQREKDRAAIQELTRVIGKKFDLP